MFTEDVFSKWLLKIFSNVYPMKNLDEKEHEGFNYFAAVN